MSGRKGDWMQTFTGQKFYSLDPRPEEVVPEDIAHALGFLCRFGGHSTHFYSVAEHCVLMSYAVEPKNALWALLHDATEAYVGDMVRPLKRHMPAFCEVEDEVMAAICTRFGLDPTFPEEVHDADNRILVNERKAVMVNTSHDWYTDGLEPLPVSIAGWYPKLAEQNYLYRLNELLETQK